MKTPAIHNDIVAFLRAAGAPRSSRELAARFLKIERGDEETCRRLLAPFLAGVSGVAHRPGEGWTWAGRAGAPRPPSMEPAGSASSRERDAFPDPVDQWATEPADAGEAAGSLLDFVALAVDGGGPGGSGAARAVSILPVVAGEPCQEDHFPAAALPDGADEFEGPALRRPASGLTRDDLGGIAETIGDLPIVCHRIGREVEPLRQACAAAGAPLQAPVISAAKLGHLLLGLKANHATVDLAAALGMTTHGPDDCRGRVRLVAEAYLRLLPRLRAQGIETLDALLEYQNMPAPPLDLSGYAFTSDDLRSLPAGPGVYRFLDRQGEVIYVGKAKNIRTRVGSYFASSARGAAKGRAILEQVHSMRIETVASELEAILLEAALIQEHRPRLNRQFEVRERPAPYGPRLNLAVVLPDAGEPTCTVHLLRDGRYCGRLRALPAGDAASPDDPRWGDAILRVAGEYFGAAVGRPHGQTDAGAAASQEIDWNLVASYLRRHRDRVNVLDLDECASAGDAGSRLLILARACVSGPHRVLAR